MSSLPEVTDATFAQEVGQFPGVTLVDFWAPWCGPCLEMAPHLEKLAEKYAANPNVRIVALDIDQNNETAFSFRVMSIPTFKVYVNGTETDEVIGGGPIVRLENAIERALQALTPAAKAA